MDTTFAALMHLRLRICLLARCRGCGARLRRPCDPFYDRRLRNYRPPPQNGFASAKSQVIGSAWRAKRFAERLHVVASTVTIEELMFATCDHCERQIHPHRLGVGVAPVPPSRSGFLSSGRPAARASRCIRSRASCTRSEKVVSATSWRAVKRSLNSSCRSCRRENRVRVWKNSLRLPLWLRLDAHRLVLRRRREIDPPAVTFGHDRHQPRAHAPRLALGLDVVAGDRRARHQALEVCPARRAWCRSSPPPHPSACPPSP